MKFRDLFEDDVPVNNAGDGKIDGIGVGDRGEPGFKPEKKKKNMVYRGVLGVKGLGDGVR